MPLMPLAAPLFIVSLRACGGLPQSIFLIVFASLPSMKVRENREFGAGTSAQASQPRRSARVTHLRSPEVSQGRNRTGSSRDL